MPRVALFGGSFNPPHVAHQLACLVTLELSGCDEVWMMPTFQHPFQKSLAPFEDRFEMCRRAAQHLGGVQVSRVEAELGGESRTLQTVKHLRRLHPAHAYTIVIGADLVDERKSWFGWDELEKMVDFFVIGRAGKGPEPQLPPISSTEIRGKLARGEDVSRVVPQSVLEYIAEKGLYR